MHLIHLKIKKGKQVTVSLGQANRIHDQEEDPKVDLEVLHSPRRETMTRRLI